MFTNMSDPDSTKAPNPKREHILATATRLLAEEGIAALSQPRVAKESGIPQGHLTYYFPKRADLMLAVVRRSLDLALAELVRFLGGRDFARAGEDARARALAVVGHLVQDASRSRVLVGLLVEAEGDDVLRQELLSKWREMRPVVASFFTREMDEADVDLLFAMLWGIGLQKLLLGPQRTRAHTETLLGRMVDLFSAAPQAAPARTTPAHTKPVKPAPRRASPSPRKPRRKS